MKNEAERAESKTIRELRKKCNRLTLEVRRLRKMLRQSETEDDEPEDEFIPMVGEVSAPTTSKPRCPKCRAEGVHVFQLMERDYYKCDACEAKGRYTK